MTEKINYAKLVGSTVQLLIDFKKEFPKGTIGKVVRLEKFGIHLNVDHNTKYLHPDYEFSDVTKCFYELEAGVKYDKNGKLTDSFILRMKELEELEVMIEVIGIIEDEK